MHNCSNEFTWKVSNPYMSKMPMNVATFAHSPGRPHGNANQHTWTLQACIERKSFFVLFKSSRFDKHTFFICQTLIDPLDKGAKQAGINHLADPITRLPSLPPCNYLSNVSTFPERRTARVQSLFSTHLRRAQRHGIQRFSSG